MGTENSEKDIVRKGFFVVLISLNWKGESFSQQNWKEFSDLQALGIASHSGGIIH